MKSFYLSILLLIISCSQSLAQAGVSYANQTLQINLNDVIDIRFVSTDHAHGPQVKMDFATAADYYNGIESTLQALQIRANTAFTVSVRAAQTGNELANASVPSFIYIRVPQNNTGGQLTQSFSSSSYQPLTNTNVMLMNNGSKGDNQTFAVQYKAKPGSMVTPGVYNIDVVFTASRY